MTTEQIIDKQSNTKKLKKSLGTHEALKAKGLRLSNQDIHDWIGVLDDLIDLSVEFESEYDEHKQQLDGEIDNAHILLKEQEGGSDTVIKAKVKQQYIDELSNLAIMKKYKILSNKKQVSVEHYINLAKKVVNK